MLVGRRWGDDYVLYHSASGDTHLLNALAAQVLELLAETPSDAVTLTNRLADVLNVSRDADIALVDIERLLANLDDLGVVESVPA